MGRWLSSVGFRRKGNRTLRYPMKVFFPLVMPGDSKKIVQDNNASIWCASSRSLCSQVMAARSACRLGPLQNYLDLYSILKHFEF